MSPRVLIVLIVVACAPGCGAGQGGSPAPGQVVVAFGPHGGRAVALPNDQGYAEVVVEPVKASARSVRQVLLAVYLLQPDLKSGLATIPTSISAAVVTPETSEPIAVSLRHDPLTARADASARFASAPGPFDYDELAGELTIELGGQTITREF